MSLLRRSQRAGGALGAALITNETNQTMIRGTTPTHQFVVPFDTSVLSEVLITYAQDNKLVLTKNIKDCTIEQDVISVTLTQEETLRFDSDHHVKIQLRALTTGGDALASQIITRSVGDVLNDEVLL